MNSHACHSRDCLLCTNGVFDGLTQAQLGRISNFISNQTYRPHEHLFREGEPCHNLFILRTGQVKITASLPNGRQQILRIHVGGHLLGLEVFDGETYSHSAEALTEVQVCSIHHKDFFRVASETPSVCRQIVHALSEELGQADSMIRDLGLKRSNERVASFLLSLAPKGNGSSAAIPLPLSRHEIGQMLGLTTETVSRVMAELQREGVIVAPRGNFRVLDVERLHTLADARRL